MTVVSTVSPAEVVAFVREGRVRPFVCSRCGVHGEMLASLGPTGRLPAQCEACEPTSSAWRRERAERPLRDTVLHLDDRLRELEALLLPSGAGDADGDRVRRCGGASRTGLGRAVRRVAYAEGASGTAEALLDLAAVARAWAGMLLRRPAKDED